jgi:hypothetical protein
MRLRVDIDVPYCVAFANRIALATYNWDYDEYCDIMHGWQQSDYTLDKWKLFVTDWCKWWGRLDEGNRERFVRALFDKYPEK